MLFFHINFNDHLKQSFDTVNQQFSDLAIAQNLFSDPISDSN